MEKFFCSIFGNSWRTSLSGYVFAILQVAHPLMTRGDVTWKEFSIAVITAIVGRIVKDAQVSGKDK